MKIRGGTGKSILRKLLYREAPASPVRPAEGRVRDARRRMDQGTTCDRGRKICSTRGGWRRKAGSTQARVQQRWQQHLSGKRDSALAIWAILMFQAWLRDQESALAAAA